jgi:hypothetical protein
MSKQITQYRIFIASPGGLVEERNAFKKAIEKTNSREGEPRGVQFLPVGWELTLNKQGRPQALINEEVKTCDYFFLVLHNRWGSSTGDLNFGSM